MTINGVAFAFGQQYKINSAYDVNNGFATTSMPGFNEMAQMWGQYRVLAAKVKTRVTLASAAANPVNVSIIMPGQSLLTPSNWTQAMRMVRGNRHAVSKVATPYQQTTLSLYRKLGTVYGDRLQYRTNLNFTANTSSSPATLMYAQVMGASLDGAALTAQVYALKTEVTMWIKFFARDIEIA